MNRTNEQLLEVLETNVDRLNECLGYLEANNAPDYFINAVKKALDQSEIYIIQMRAYRFMSGF